jgi:hypothetical protein
MRELKANAGIGRHGYAVASLSEMRQVIGQPHYRNVPFAAACRVAVADVGKQSAWGLRFIAKISIVTVESSCESVNLQKQLMHSFSTAAAKTSRCHHPPLRRSAAA